MTILLPVIMQYYFWTRVADRIMADVNWLFALIFFCLSLMAGMMIDFLLLSWRYHK